MWTLGRPCMDMRAISQRVHMLTSIEPRKGLKTQMSEPKEAQKGPIVLINGNRLSLEAAMTVQVAVEELSHRLSGESDPLKRAYGAVYLSELVTIRELFNKER